MPAASVSAYLAALPKDRRDVVAKVRAVVNEHLPKGYEEGIQYGMIGWYVPKSLYPAGYHTNPKEPLPFVSLAAQKSHYALYLACVYGDPSLSEWFEREYAKTGKKLDMGKSCVRFKALEDLPLDLVGRTIARVPVADWIAAYEASRGGANKPAAAKKPAAKEAGAAKKKAGGAKKKAGGAKKPAAKKKAGGPKRPAAKKAGAAKKKAAAARPTRTSANK